MNTDILKACEKDNYRSVSPILRKIMKKIFDEREDFPVEYLSYLRKETVNNGLSCVLWFISPGCSHDNLSGCTMCNYGYGKGFHYNKEEIIKSTAKNIKSLPSEVFELTVGPTGSLPDDREVSPALRKSVLSLLRDKKCKNFMRKQGLIQFPKKNQLI